MIKWKVIFVFLHAHVIYVYIPTVLADYDGTRGFKITYAPSSPTRRFYIRVQDPLTTVIRG